MKIQVLGSGCPTCKKLFELTKQATVDLGVKTEVEYAEDIQKIIEMGVMSSPVLAIDGKPVIAGYLPNLGKIKEVLKAKDHKREDCDDGCGCGGKC